MAHQVAMYFQSGNSQAVISHPSRSAHSSYTMIRKDCFSVERANGTCGITQLRCGLLFSFFSLHIFVVFNFPSWCSKVMGRELADLAQIKLWKLGLSREMEVFYPYSFFRISENNRKVAYRKNILRRWHFRNLECRETIPRYSSKGTESDSTHGRVPRTSEGMTDIADASSDYRHHHKGHWVGRGQSAHPQQHYSSVREK